MKKIHAIYMRGGTSKGPFFDLRDLPSDTDQMKEVLLKIMGSPDKKQIDGMGGATTVTSKVVMVQPSEREGIDVDYLFAQVFINEALVDIKPTCGNMMSGVAPFAIEKGWVKADDVKTIVNVYNINTDSKAEMHVETPGAEINYTDGSLVVDGVPGSGAPILMRLSDIEGGATGKLFPTGNVIDTVQGKELTLFDAGNLMIHMRAEDFDLTGMEKGNCFEDQTAFMSELESIRCEVGRLAGLGDVSNSVLPKIGLLTKPQKGGSIRSLYFTPKSFHPTHAVSGAVCVLASSKYKGTIASQLVVEPQNGSNQYVLEHQCGSIPVELMIEGEGPDFKIISAGTYRTARKLMEGHIFY